MKFEKTLLLLAALCSVITLIPAEVFADGGGCWRLSSASTQNMCVAQGKICIEWGDGYESGPIATACCNSMALPTGCAGTCALLERPLMAGPITTRTLPEAGPALKNADTKPIRPEMAVTYRGEVYGPDAVQALDGRELHYLFVLDDGTGSSALYALDDRRQLAKMIAELNRSEDPSLTAQIRAGHEPGVSLFAEKMWQEANYFLPAGASVDFQHNWWANKISSVRGSGAPTWLTLFEGPDYSGSSLTFSTGWDRPALGVFGWDDRASSAYLWARQDKAEKPLELVRSIF
ncbi:MAG: hypothetical protein AAGM22_20770 [Acidobacteriota bacterium]